MPSPTINSTLRLLALLTIIYGLPWAAIHFLLAPSPEKIKELEPSDAVLVFGALVRNNTISPLQKERLLAAKHLLDERLVSTIVVSNEQKAAELMFSYLVGQGVPREHLELDGNANKTPDTCRNERDNHGKRRLVFLSQYFHLSRTYYQCKKLGVTGQLFAADSLNIIDRSQSSWATILRVRSLRYIREAGLTWLAVLNIYR